MDEIDIIICPNCQKQFKRIPKGKLTCRCGQRIQTNGNKLKNFEHPPAASSCKEKLPDPVEVLLALALLIIPLSFFLRFQYGGTWLEKEANFFSNLFGISSSAYEGLKVLIGSVATLFWLRWRRKKNRNRN